MFSKYKLLTIGSPENSQDWWSGNLKYTKHKFPHGEAKTQRKKEKKIVKTKQNTHIFQMAKIAKIKGPSTTVSKRPRQILKSSEEFAEVKIKWLLNIWKDTKSHS